MPRTFHIIAHRGDSAREPENTLRAFDAALKAGADGIECDVRVTRDGVAVLLHDESLARTTRHEAEVKDVGYEDVRKLDAAAYLSESAKPAAVPTLDEALDKYLPRIQFDVELKAFGAVLPAIHSLQRRAAEGAFERVLLTSFKQQLLVSALMLDGRCKAGLILPERHQVTVSEVKHMGAVAVLPHWTDVSKDMVDEAHKLNMGVICWGAKELEHIQKVLDTGADGASYDDPKQLLAYLNEKGLRDHDLPLPLLSSLYQPKAQTNGKTEKVAEKVVAKAAR